MATNKRRGEPALPSDPDGMLSEEQQEALRKLEGFGWSLHIIRRPKFEPVEVLLRHSDGKWMQLLDNGELDQKNAVARRKEDEMDDAQSKDDVWSNATDDQGFELKEPEVPLESPTVNNEPVPTSTNPNGRPPKVIV